MQTTGIEIVKVDPAEDAFQFIRWSMTTAFIIGALAVCAFNLEPPPAENTDAAS